MKTMRHVIPVFVLMLIISLSQAVPPPQLLQKGPEVVPNVLLRKQLNARFIVPPNGMPGTVNIPSPRPRRAIQEEHLLTRSGQMFHGTFKGFDPDKGILWSHPDMLPEVLPFLPDRVRQLNFKVAPLPARAKAHTCRVKLANGDSLSGDLLQMENGKLILNTWYAGEMAIDIAHIKSLKPGFSTARVFFEGPKDPKNWAFNNTQNAALQIQGGFLPPEALRIQKERAAQAAKAPTWKYSNGTFESVVSNAMVGREMKEMPDSASIEFDVDWSSSMNLYVNFLTDSLKSYSMCNGYCLRLTQSYIYLYRYNFNNGRGGGGRVGNNVRVNLAGLQGNAHVAIKVDSTKKTLGLFINDALVQKWENLGEFPGDGKGLLFTSRATYRMRLSRIRVTEWNGSLPGPEAEPKASPKDDYIHFNNADHLKGEMTAITDGKLKFNSALGEMNIAIEKVGEIHRATERVRAVPAMPGMARAVFKDQSSLLMKITGWKDGKVTATSPLFGEAAFDASVFESIDFSPDLEKKTAQAPNNRPSTIPNPRQQLLKIRGGIPLPLNPQIKPRR